jgi:hypothetical protein
MLFVTCAKCNENAGQKKQTTKCCLLFVFTGILIGANVWHQCRKRCCAQIFPDETGNCRFGIVMALLQHAPFTV